MFAAISMAGSSIIVAVNAVALKRLRLPRPMTTTRQTYESGGSEQRPAATTTWGST